jgi:RluA family pseudouridine synthase
MIEILYQDDHCIIVNKPPNLLTVPSRESTEKVNLLYSLKDQIDLHLYPIHRLDRQTSGIVIFGKTKEFVRAIKEIWSGDQVEKYYTALVEEVNLEANEYNFELKSEKGNYQEAITKFRPLKHYETCTLIEAQIFTGRRHQIRRHFSRRMQHVVGDRRYGKKRVNNFYLDNYGLERLFLHCHRFKFYHPMKDMFIEIDCPLYEDLQSVLKKIEANS